MSARGDMLGGVYRPVVSWHEAAERYQRVLNALPIPARREQREAAVWIPIRARVVWELDGQDIFETDALGWTRHAVHVRLEDRRLRVKAVWLSPADVQRR